MMNTQTLQTMTLLDRDFTVELVTSQAALQAAQRLRYQVYCLERKHQVGDSGAQIEGDEYDAGAHHLLLRERRSGTPVGTARLLVGARGRAGQPAGLPMLHYCPAGALSALPPHSTAEISRFALSKEHRNLGDSAERMLRFALMRGILRTSLNLGLTHWCALMEPSLLRLLRFAGIDFKPLGPAVHCYGWRIPCAAAIPRILEASANRCPEIYRFVAARADASLRHPMVNAA